MEQKRRKCRASLRPSRAFGNRQAVPVGADHPEDRTAQFKFEGIGAVASRFRRNAEQRAAQCHHSFDGESSPTTRMFRELLGIMSSGTQPRVIAPALSASETVG